MPKVSVIMNCYNGEKYLKEAIDSIYRQTFTDWEIIFFDNASTDSSASIAKSYDSKIKYFYNKVNVKLGEARKLALEKATGKWIAFLDTDDIWLENKLEDQLRMVDGSDYVMCYSGISDIDENGSVIRSIIPKYESGNMLSQQLIQFDINMVTPLINSDILKKYQISFNDNIIASEEYNLFVRLAAKGKICTIPSIHGLWRISQNSLTYKSAKYWYYDRIMTLDQLVQESPWVPEKFSKELKQAYIRAYYYKARWYMIEGKRNLARKEMIKISLTSPVYFILTIISFCASCWNFLHSDEIKRVLSSRFFNFSKSA